MELEYLTYTRYKELGGTLPTTTFNFLYSKSKYELDRYTFNRLIDFTETTKEIEICMFDLISHIEAYNPHITSESANGYSVSYNTEIDVIKEIINRYMTNLTTKDGVPVLYRGV